MMTHSHADQDAEEAARRANVTIREVEAPADLRAVAELLSVIWESPLVPPPLVAVTT